MEADLLRRGKRPVFLMNAGIFEPGGIPSGLHVEGGKEVLPLTLAEGKGNFFLKPNGVFFVEGERARVMRSEAYALSKATPRFALQSGPLLLFQGKIHPQFRKKSESKLHRNGVGILPDGRVLFLMTDLRKTRVNLYTFAELFRSFGCQEALFLDGDLSRMWVDSESQAPGTIPEEGSRELAPGVPAGNHFGAVLAVTVSAE
ncbi:MAG: phosphodiester glycosidase family protein [Verrucomicrobiota bacterium]